MYLLHAHQIEAMQASAARDDADRQSHLDAAAGYAEQIEEWRNALRNEDPPSSADSPVWPLAVPLD